MWGFLTSLNNVLIPHLKSVFALSYAASALVQFAFFLAFFVVSLPAGVLIATVGFKSGILIGLATTAVGALLFYPAASIPSYPFFLAALFILASGITILQVGANPYVSALGPPRTASSRLNLAQAFNSLGTTLAPALGGLLILSGAHATGDLAAARSVRLPYLGIALVLFALAGVVTFFKMPSASAVEEEAPKAGGLIQALQVRHLLLAVVGIFFYVGAEVSIGSFLVNFLVLPWIGGLSDVEAAGYVSYYWGGAMVGRFIGSALLRKIDPGKGLGVCAIAATTLVLAAVSFSGPVAMWALVAVGLFNSIMFPTIFSLGIAGLGRLTSHGSSLLIMAIVGGAVLPVLVGLLGDLIGIHRAFALTAACYVYIAYYGFRGSRVDRHR